MYELNPPRSSQDRAVRASVEFSDYLRDLVRARRSDPRDDLISLLAQVVDEGERPHRGRADRHLRAPAQRGP
jgi:cytochrome P450